MVSLAPQESGMYDCAMNRISDIAADSAAGTGECDDGSWYSTYDYVSEEFVDLYCEEWWYDDGDCDFITF